MWAVEAHLEPSPLRPRMHLSWDWSLIPGTAMWDAGILSNILTAMPNAALVEHNIKIAYR